MASGSPSARADLIDAAIAIGDAEGIKTAALMTPQMVAQLAGVSRSTIYRYWSSAIDLNDDLMRYALTVRPEWQAGVLAADPSVELASILRRHLERPAGEPGVILRCGAHHAIDSYPSAIEVIGAERRWLAAFESWLRCHLSATGRQMALGTSVAALAGAVASLVEGALLASAAVRGFTHAGWTTADADAVVVAIDAVLAEATELAPQGPERPAPLPSARPLAEASPRDRIIAAAFEAAVALVASGTELSPPIRMVDPDLLAERAGVTPRWVYAAWPTTADYDADIIDAVLARYQAEATAAAHATLHPFLRGDAPLGPEVAATMFRDAIRVAADTDRLTFVHCVLATRAGPMRARAAARYVSWLPHFQLELFVLLHGLGREVRPELDLGDFVRIVAGTLLGASRMCRAETAAGAGPDRAEHWGEAVALVLRAVTRPTA